jgi:hypothetical protein
LDWARLPARQVSGQQSVQLSELLAAALAEARLRTECTMPHIKTACPEDFAEAVKKIRSDE